MIPLSEPYINGNEWKYVKECLDTGWVSSAGEYVDLFESKFKKYIGIENAVATINGTAALHLALLSLGIMPGDEVIVPSFTFIAPVNAIKYVGAEPVFVDVCRDTFVMDTEKIESLISKRTKAILPVHIYGNPVNMDKVLEIAQKYDLRVIEDATESLGSMYKSKHTGSIGHIGCFSFNGNKLITTGSGGMLVTNNKELALRAKHLSTQAKIVKDENAFWHDEIGYNYRLPNLLAAMGVAQIENLNYSIESKKRIAKEYTKRLSGVKGITLPVQKENTFNVNWLYSIIIEEDFYQSRDKVITNLKENGIQSRQFFTPIHLMQPYVNQKKEDLSVSEDIYHKGICLPSSVSLNTEDVVQISNIILKNI